MSSLIAKTKRRGTEAMILTRCAVRCPLETKCFRCGVCSSTIVAGNAKNGTAESTRGLCPEIKRGGGAEQYNADKEYKEFVAVGK